MIRGICKFFWNLVSLFVNLTVLMLVAGLIVTIPLWGIGFLVFMFWFLLIGLPLIFLGGVAIELISTFFKDTFK